jgi:hypothetical protein
MLCDGAYDCSPESASKVASAVDARGTFSKASALRLLYWVGLRVLHSSAAAQGLCMTSSPFHSSWRRAEAARSAEAVYGKVVIYLNLQLEPAWRRVLIVDCGIGVVFPWSNGSFK